MKAKELLEKYAAGERQFGEANLCEANLCEANLYGANLSRAKLYGADLYGAKLNGADLFEADLREADLREANLCGANLSEADLSEADLFEADLCGADLFGAVLSRAKLREANLCGADLSATILDHELHQRQREFYGLAPPAGRSARGRILYRTARSQHVGDTLYVPGNTYVAPYLSHDPLTACHPGIYAAPLEWLRRQYPRPGIEAVRVYVRDGDYVICEKGVRCKRLRVLDGPFPLHGDGE